MMCQSQRKSFFNSLIVCPYITHPLTSHEPSRLMGTDTRHLGLNWLLPNVDQRAAWEAYPGQIFQITFFRDILSVLTLLFFKYLTSKYNHFHVLFRSISQSMTNCDVSRSAINFLPFLLHRHLPFCLSNFIHHQNPSGTCSFASVNHHDSRPPSLVSLASFCVMCDSSDETETGWSQGHSCQVWGLMKSGRLTTETAQIGL